MIFANSAIEVEIHGFWSTLAILDLHMTTVTRDAQKVVQWGDIVNG